MKKEARVHPFILPSITTYPVQGCRLTLGGVHLGQVRSYILHTHKYLLSLLHKNPSIELGCGRLNSVEVLLKVSECADCNFKRNKIQSVSQQATGFATVFADRHVF